MVLRFTLWNGSLALRVPDELARQIHASDGAEFDVKIEGGKMVLTPLESHRYTLDELLAGMTEENIHGEISTGRPIGNEAL
jgi:antitoxin MazE